MLATVVLVDPKLLYCFLSLHFISSLLISKAVDHTGSFSIENSPNTVNLWSSAGDICFTWCLPKPCSASGSFLLLLLLLSSASPFQLCFSFPVVLLLPISASTVLPHNWYYMVLVRNLDSQTPPLICGSPLDSIFTSVLEPCCSML